MKKTKISLEKQNYNGKLDHMYFTKLDFAGLESELSPLCALIIFDHTDLSLCCLQTLQKLSINFKDSYVFFAVCCNGTKDMLNVFSNDDIKIYLTKLWGGCLYPINSASLFHNYEILQILIEFGVNVNQRYMDDDTALLFAIRHIIKVSDNNTNARHYKTLQLLLCNGADINLCDAFGIVLSL